MISFRITESILLAVFLGASGDIANLLNSKATFPSFILFAAIGLDQIATAYIKLSYAATKQM